MATQNTTHKAEALARLPERNKNKTTLAALVNACTNETQNIENALWQLLSDRSIDTAEGEQLDVLGRIVNQDRATTADDEEYRVLLKARVIANRSSGSVKDILATFQALIGSLDGVELEQIFPASFILHVITEDGFTEDFAALYADFVAETKAAGINAQFHYSTSPESETFACPASTVTTEYFDIGVQTSCVVESTEGFPSSGFVIFDQGDDSAQMIVKYTSKTAQSFEGCTMAEGSVGGRTEGAIVTSPGLIVSQITNDFEGEPFPSSIELYDSSAFPTSGYFVLHYARPTRRVFSYTGNEANTLTGIVATSEGTHTTFGADSLIVFIDQHLSSTEESSIGGSLSSIIEV